MTAVEWLEKEIEKSIIPAQKHYFKWAFKKAKELEKPKQEKMYSEEKVFKLTLDALELDKMN